MESEKPKDGLVLVGFGKHDLADVLKWAGTDKEMDLLTAFKKWPPVYREERNCSQEDIQTACDFLAYLQDAIMEYEKGETDEPRIITDNE